MAIFGWKNKIDGLMIGHNDASGMDVCNERLVRGIAGVNMVGIATSLIFAVFLSDFTVVQNWSIFMLLDSLARFFFGMENSVVGTVVKHLIRNQTFLPVAADPNQFTVAIQIMVASYMATASNVLHWFDWRLVAPGSAVAVLMWLLSAMGICVGCMMWSILVKIKLAKSNAVANSCVGGTCILSESMSDALPDQAA